MPALDVIIVGAGPAGVSAALWARTLELEPIVIEAGERGGGQLHDIHFHPRELPGIAAGDGAALVRTFEQQLAEARVLVRTGTIVRELEPHPKGVRVRLDEGGTLDAPAVMLATGTRRRRLEVPGEAELWGKGVFGSARREIQRLKGRNVAVIGGGDGAYENALILSEAGCRVVLFVRGAPTARAEFQHRAEADRSIEVVSPVAVAAFSGEEGRVRIELVPGGRDIREVEAAVVKIGREPVIPECLGIDREPDVHGYLVVDRAFRTSVAGIWAAGDIIGPARPSIGAAIGSAGLAMMDIRKALRGE
jgi:thioredoxin reductase (NADPH)